MADDLDYDKTLRGLNSGMTLFDRYRLVRQLGRGGMGVVWLAQDLVLGEEVALKCLREDMMRDEGALEDLKREVLRGRKLTHPHILRIHEFITDSHFGAIVMEFVDGPTLSKVRSQRPDGAFRPDDPELQRWLGQLVVALEYAHEEARVVHRDLKPANLLIDAKGNLKVADFGIARSLSETLHRLTRPGSSSAGTLVYMSPQQLLGSPPAVADDIYAFGAMLYELLTGKPPFFSGSIERQIETITPPPMAERRRELGNTTELDIPPQWEQTVAACLEKDVARRPQSVREVWGRMQTPAPPAAAPQNPAAIPPISPAPPPPPVPVPVEAPPQASRRSGKRRDAVVAGVVGALLLAVVCYFVFRPGKDASGRKVEAEWNGIVSTGLLSGWPGDRKRLPVSLFATSPSDSGFAGASEVANAIALADPAAAAAWAETLVKGTSQARSFPINANGEIAAYGGEAEGAFSAALASGCWLAPSRTAEWIDRQPDSPVKWQWINATAHAWANEAHAAAVAWVKRQPKAPEQNDVLRHIDSLLLGSEAIPNRSEKTMKNIELAWVDPYAAMAATKTLPGEESAVLAIWALQNPEAACAWLKTADEAQVPFGYDAVAVNWGLKNPAAAVAWYASLDAENPRKESPAAEPTEAPATPAVAEAAPAAPAPAEAAPAEAPAAAPPLEKTKASIVRFLFAEWARGDVAAARRWIESSPTYRFRDDAIIGVGVTSFAAAPGPVKTWDSVWELMEDATLKMEWGGRLLTVWQKMRP